MATLCNKCGLFISHRKAEKALLRHEWCDHRGDAPKNEAVSDLLKVKPEGKKTDTNQGDKDETNK